MKKFGIVLIAVMLIVSIIGTISASAITIGEHWYLYELFNKENGKTYREYSQTSGSNTYYVLRKQTDPFQDYKAGSLVMANTNGTRAVMKNNLNHGSTIVGTDDTNRCAWIRGVTSGVTGNAYLPTTYFYGEPSSAPSGRGSSVVSYGNTVDTTDSNFKYAYIGSRFFEQSFYIAQLGNTDILVRPSLRLEGADSNITPTKLTLKFKSGNPGNITLNDVNTGKTISKTAYDSTIPGYPSPDWHQVKYVYDFDEGIVDLYLDGDKITTYTPSAPIYYVTKVELSIGSGATYVIDDFLTDPHDGRSLTPFFTDFFVDGLKVQNTAAGDAKAVVKLYKDIPASYVVVGARYDTNGRLVDVKLMNESDADAIENSIIVDFGEIAATDKLMVTAWDSMGTITPLVASTELVPAA